MSEAMRKRVSALLGLWIGALVLTSGTAVAATDSQPGYAGELHVVATAHLDTQWRWTIQTTIDEYLRATLRDNFALLEKYPDYVFSFEGAFRYQLMKEYYPAEYERLKQYIAAGRWHVAGSWLDAVDVNVPSPEALIRNALYGNGYFQSEFGVKSRDIFLPDCFGFGFALPSVAAHSGLLGFSTQKLTWGSSVGIPFDIGLWEGVDGSTVIAAVNPGAYVSRIESDLSVDSTWTATVLKQGEQSGVYAGYKYYGTGDVGGAPTDDSVAWLTRSMAPEGNLRVRAVASDQLMRELTPEQQAGLPRYRGEMLMTRHGVGCYTSQAAMKRWNRQNEVLADAAERAAVVADWFGAADYPRARLTTAWSRFLWHGFHDDLTGTSIPEAYVFSWNDELLSLNEFAAMATNAVGGVSRALDTRADGVPLVVYNPLSIAREDLVEAVVRFPDGEPEHVRVFGPDGAEVPAQFAGESTAAGKRPVVFLARVPAVGFAVYDVRPSDTPCALATGLSAGTAATTLQTAASRCVLENPRYRVSFDQQGFLASVHDKQLDKELLAAPLHLQLLDDTPQNWPAWEIDYDDLTAAPRATAATLAERFHRETGPARVSVTSSVPCESSTITQRVSLGAGGAQDRVEIAMTIEWRTPATLLKAAVPLNVANEHATYDLGLGTIERPTNTPTLYEVPAQRWADLTATSGDHGVAVLSNCRYGWDKPDDHTLRLSLVHTPAVNSGWRWVADERSQDLGLHHLNFGLYGHAGDWRNGVAWQADRLTQPLLAFQVPAHEGPLGRQFALLTIEPAAAAGAGNHERPPAVAIRALKHAEQSDEIVVRLQEINGRATGKHRLAFARPIVAAREINGAEEPVGEAILDGGCLLTELNPYQPRSFALRLAEAPTRLDGPFAVPVQLPYDIDGVSRDDRPTDGDFSGAGHTLAGELLPASLVRDGIPFRTGPQDAGRANVLACRGQRIELPAGDFSHLYVLAAAIGGGRLASFDCAGKSTELWIQDYAAPIGAWNNRIVDGFVHHEPEQITAAYINRARVGWVGTHRHGPDGENEPYVFTHFFTYRIELPPGARSVRFPDDESVRVLAATAARNENDVAEAATDLYDRYDFTSVEILTGRREFLDSIEVVLRSPNPQAVIRYTLDGSEPAENSPLYDGVLTVTEATTVKARAYAPDLRPSAPAVAELTELTARSPAAERPTHDGLVCDYYEGAWNELPDFRALTPLRTDIAQQVEVPPHAAAEDIGLVLTGYLRVPRRGVYRLHLWSDDGSALYLGDERLIDNDGLHGRVDMAASVALDPGLHPIRVEFFQHLGGVDLELGWEGPDLPLQPVPVTALQRDATR